MIKLLHINNYKSLKKLEVDVGRFNVLIGENGAGKSNFLEVIASYSAIIANSFSNEFMLSRGIRVVEPKDIFSCFNNSVDDEIKICISEDKSYACLIDISINKEDPYSPLNFDINLVPRTSYKANKFKILNIKDINHDDLRTEIKSIIDEYGSVKNFKSEISNLVDKINNNKYDEVNDKIKNDIVRIDSLNKVNALFNEFHNTDKNDNSSFVIYSPELSSLRNFYSDSQIEPLGVNGEGLLKLLQNMQDHEPENFKKLCDTIEVFQWVEKIIIEKDTNNIEHRIKIVDRFMGRTIDHRSANEGFLFVLFYAALFSSKFTPKCFAVDNIDASLNPKLCRILIKELIKLAKENGKQAFVTTHNPAILDGLDLHDDEQRLFVVERNDEGATQLRRVDVDDLPKPKRNGETIKLSEAFMRGHLGGLPTNF